MKSCSGSSSESSKVEYGRYSVSPRTTSRSSGICSLEHDTRISSDKAFDKTSGFIIRGCLALGVIQSNPPVLKFYAEAHRVQQPSVFKPDYPTQRTRRFTPP